MSLFRIVAKIGIDASEFNAGLKQAESGVSSSMAAIGSKISAAFSTAAIIEFSRRVVQAAGDVNDLADQFNETVENIQAMQVAAEEAGIEWGTYASILAKVKKAQADVLAGDPKAQELFSRLGLTANQPAFSILQQLGNEQDTAAVIDLIGVKSQKAINSLRELKDLGDREMFSKETAQRFDAFGASLSSIFREYSAMAGNFANEILKIGDAWMMNIEFQKRYNEELKQLGFKNPFSANISAMMEMLLGPRGTDSVYNRIMGEIQRDAQEKAGGSLVGGRPNRPFSRETGEMFGPQEYQSIFDSGDKLIKGATIQNAIPASAAQKRIGMFSPIDMGDRANVGGFFGPNADLNRSMQRTLASMDQSLKTIEKSVSATMNTP